MAHAATTIAPRTQPLARVPVRLHVPDLVVLTIVGGCVLEASAKLLSGPDPLVQILLVIAWTAAAAKRLVDWRHGKAPAVALEDAPHPLALAVGMAPWFGLLLMDGSFQNWSPWASITFPPPFRIVGAVVIVSGVLGPFWIALRTRTTFARAGGFAYAFGFLLLSSSPLIGVLATGWLALRYCVHRDLPAPAPSFA
jgi:hypothetical protein